MRTLEWEKLLINKEFPLKSVVRAKVFGGWLVAITEFSDLSGDWGGLTFVPDPKHEWDGGSIE